MSDPNVVVELPSDGVALLRLNRPKRLNAISNDLMREIVGHLEAFDRDGTTRVAVITGDARAFAAGADITELRDPGPDFTFWDRLWNVGIPLVAAVRGMALGGGLELAMSCDFIVAAEDARLGQPEIKLGLIPGAGGTQRLTHALGKTLAMEMVILGRELTGREACERGLVTQVAPAERTLRAALDLAAEIARAAPLAVRGAKRSVLDAFNEGLAQSLRHERREFHALLATEDAAEGIAAFTERRAPRWSNH